MQRQTAKLATVNQTLIPQGNETLWGLYRFGGYALPHYANVRDDGDDVLVYYDPRDFTPADRATVYDHFINLDEPDLSNDEFIVAHLSK